MVNSPYVRLISSAKPRGRAVGLVYQAVQGVGHYRRGIGLVIKMTLVRPLSKLIYNKCSLLRGNALQPEDLRVYFRACWFRAIQEDRWWGQSPMRIYDLEEESCDDVTTWHGHRHRYSAHPPSISSVRISDSIQLSINYWHYICLIYTCI
jgi:hypothetical protein